MKNHLNLLPALFFIASCFAQPQADAYERVIYVPRSVTIYSQPYAFPENNIAALSDLREAGIKVKLARFVAAEGDSGSILCRGWFPIAPGGRVTFSEFVRAALIGELTEAGVYSDDAGVELTFQMDSIDFNSVTPATWTYQASLSAQKDDPQVFSYKHTFDAPLGAAGACQSVGSAFVPSVQGFLGALYTDQRFRALLVKPD